MYRSGLDCRLDVITHGGRKQTGDRGVAVGARLLDQAAIKMMTVSTVMEIYQSKDALLEINNR